MTSTRRTATAVDLTVGRTRKDPAPLVTERGRVHRSTCGRISAMATGVTLDVLLEQPLATCCKPTEAHVAAAKLACYSALTAEASTDGYVPSTDRNLVAEKRARLDAPKRSRSRKSGDPRQDRARGSLQAEVQVTILAGQPTVLPLTATTYPEALEGTALCYGACAQVLPVTRFVYVANKGDGKGRVVECGACQKARLAANVAARAAGLPTTPRPRATV